MFFRFLLTIMILVVGCAPQMGRISSRSPDLFEKESDHLAGRSRGTEPAPGPEMYVKQKTLAINDVDKPNDTGSLFNPDDERNYLFTPTGPLNVGRFLKVKIVPNRADGKKKDEAPGKAGAKAEAKNDKNDKKSDEIEQELLKSLPDLEPAAKGDPALLKDFKMQITHRYPNGDVLAVVTRKSGQEDQVNEITAQARIPYDRLSSGDELTTEDLLDVKMRESRDGDIAERSSSGWEDEYSLRLSGFNEARSKMAMELQDQKKKMAEASEKYETKVKAFGEERRQFAKQRDDLNKKKAETTAKIQDLETKVKDQESTIEKQNEELQSLTPEDKPSDGKEGGNAKAK